MGAEDSRTASRTMKGWLPRSRRRWIGYMPGTPRLRQSGPRRTGVDHHHHHHRSRVTRPSVQARRCSGWLAQGSFSSGPLQRQSTDQADRHWQAVAGSGSSGGGKTQQMLGNPTIKSAEQMCTLPTPIERFLEWDPPADPVGGCEVCGTRVRRPSLLAFLLCHALCPALSCSVQAGWPACLLKKLCRPVWSGLGPLPLVLLF